MGINEFMKNYGLLLLAVAMIMISADGRQQETEEPFLVVLGMAQDGGVPHAGTLEHKGFEDLAFKRHAACLGIVDPASGQRWMIEATPDFREQLYRLDRIFPKKKPRLDGIFVTHAHIGHYTGLMYLGRESLGTKGIPVHAMPRMCEFLKGNGPWSQLVKFENIDLKVMKEGEPVRLNDRLSVIPFLVPHRQEYSEVAGFIVKGPSTSVLFIPDIDRWEDWDVQIESMIEQVDVAYLDGTFFDDNELPGRDMSKIPHPLITKSMKRFQPLSKEERGKVRFIHLNHSNPAIWKDSDARKRIEEGGFHVAEELERIDL